MTDLNRNHKVPSPRSGGDGGGLWVLSLLLPVILFALLALFLGLPAETIVTRETFIFQYAMTLLTIALIPLLLWRVRRERFKEERNYNWAVAARLTVFCVMALVDIAAYFYLPNASFFYLAVVTYLSMFFARK